MTLHINSTRLATIEESALASTPEECCGLLLGRVDNGEHLVEGIQTTANMARSDRHRRYEIDPKAVFEALREATKSGGQVLGFFHSHPDGTLQPSWHDVQTAWPDKSYLIVGVESLRIVGVRSWRLGPDDPGMVEELITLTDGRLLH